MEGEVALCWVCHSSRKQLICPLCACNAINTDKSSLRELGVAILRRTKLKEELETVVEQKDTIRIHAGQLASTKTSISKAKACCKIALQKRHQALREISTLKGSLARRQRILQQSRDKSDREEASLNNSSNTTESRQKLLQSRILVEKITVVLRKQVRLLSAALPFRVVNARPQDHAQEGGKANLASTGSEMSGSNALLVSICGLQLPESPSIPVGANRQKLSTALGDLVVLVEVLAALLRVPLLHCLHFRGSTSRLWQPKSFWDDRRAKAAPTHRLYYATTVPAPSAPQGPPKPPETETLAGNALAAVKQRWPFETAFSRTANAASPRINVSDSRQEEDLQMAILQLTRNVGLLCREELLNELCLAHQDCSPLATLAGFCMQLATQPRTDGRHSLTASLAAPPPTWEAERNILVESFETDGTDNEEEVDGWDVIQRPVGWHGASLRSADVLPPRPSENEDAITHWERAMILDSSETSVGRAHKLLMGQIAPLREGAFAAADRLWQGFMRTRYAGPEARH